MCSRYLRISLVGPLWIVTLLALGGCQREKRQFQSSPVTESGPMQVRTTDLQAGQTTPLQPDARRALYENNAYNLSEGKRLYQWFNCVGCHAHGGGDSGPPLIDSAWRYGGEIEQIYATIQQGRPNGMPAFGGKIPEQQIWQIAGYVRSISGNLSRSASPGRNDEMQTSPPEQLMEKQPPVTSSPAATEGTQK
jgi:cytochrome c oxidase cbb3-type subunit 3